MNIVVAGCMLVTSTPVINHIISESHKNVVSDDQSIPELLEHLCKLTPSLSHTTMLCLTTN